MSKLISIVVISMLFSCTENSTAEQKNKKADKAPSQLALNANKDVGIQIGDIAPEIQLLNPKGELVALSSLRGKYVLVDFWAAWCRPCRAENPNTVKLYQKYKNKGFEVFGVSLDKDKDAWNAAIKYDRLTWTHVSDLKWWDSEVIPLYQVRGIPMTYLLDKEGRILATNLRGVYLAAKLQELLGE